MKSCLIEEDSEDALEFNVIDESIKIISEIKNQISISKKVLIEKLNRPEKLVNYLIESLEKKNHISIQDLENDEVISLTDFGKDYFSNILKSFSSKLIVENENLVKSNKNLSPEEIPSFIGALISDKDGRTLLKIELNEDYLKKFLFKRENLDPSSILADLDLIPMFISALEKFSMELNIHDLSGFNLSGSNLKLNIISYDLYNVILFMNPDVNIDPLKIRIQNYFNNIFDEHNELFNKCLKTGQTDLLSPILKETKNWLEDINKTYQNMIINLEIIDIEHAKRLYDQIDNLYEKVSQTFGITLDKIKKLKVNLMKAILEKNYEELISISNHAKKLSLKFAA
jgi:DNA-binding MarR family transcriptional regulator